MASELEIIEAYGDMSTSLIKKVGEAAEQAFYDLPDYRGPGQRLEYFEIYEQILFGARIQAAELAIGFHREIARVNGKRFRAPKLRKEDFFPNQLRNIDVEYPAPGAEPYQVRPFRELYRYLNKYPEAMTEAVKQGGYRARILAQTDVQLARRQASLFARRANDNVVGYIRVLTGAESCGLCYIASTQRYRKGDLNPIHPGCDCGELPIYGDTDPGRVIDQYNLDRTHEAFENRFGAGTDPQARDLGIGKFVEYKDGVRQADFTLISIREHGELGPVLTRRDENFTTLADIQKKIEDRKRIFLTPPRPELTEIGLRSSARQLTQRIKAANTREKISEILSEGLDMQVLNTSGIPDADFAVGEYQLFGQQLVELQDKYPAPLEALQLKRRKDAYAWVYRDNPLMGVSQLTLDNRGTSQTALLRDWAEQINSGHFGKWLETSNVDPVRYVVVHEYGHLLDQFGGGSFKPRNIIRKLALEGVSDDDLKAWGEKNVQLFRLYLDADGELTGTDKSHVISQFVDKYIEENISKYAITGESSRHETIAEAFAQVYFRGEDAHPAARAVTQRLLKEYNTAVKESGLSIASQVTDAEVDEIASQVIQGLSPEGVSAAAAGDLLPEASSLIARTVRAAALVKKKTSLAGAAVNFLVQEVVQDQVIRRVRERVQRQAQNLDQ